MSLKDRTRFFVNSRVQGQILLRFAAYWVVYHIVLWHTLFLYRYCEYRFELAMGTPPQTFAQLYGTFCRQYYPIVFSALAVLPVLLWDIVKITHRLVGPLIRFQRSLERLTAGERVDPIQLRQGDYLQEFQQQFNAFLETHRRQLDELELWQATQAHTMSGPDSAPTTTAELLERVQALTETIQSFAADGDAVIGSR